MINLTLKHFRYFEALARFEHFGRAAEACAISQPALSMQIKELEALVGAPLVERTARQVRLTTLGEEFLVRAQKVLRDVEDISELARKPDGPLTGRLRMGIIPTLAPYLLPEVIRRLSEILPDLELRPRETVTQTLLDDLMQSRLDFIIAALPISEPSLREFALFEEEFVLIRSARDAATPVPSPHQLQEMKLLLLEEGHCFRDQALSLCEMSPSDPTLLMEGSSLATLVQMVDAGLGLTLIPEMAVPLETKGTDVVVSRFRDQTPRRTVGMVWRKTNPLEKQLMELGATIRQIGQAQRSRAVG
ncbi:MAG: hydrogen peroxide-inducible genes activator [Pseudomonadota bacterium]